MEDDKINYADRDMWHRLVALHRAFRERAWIPQGTSLEPELDWHADVTATEAGYGRRWH